jgi:hypothetical protein
MKKILLVYLLFTSVGLFAQTRYFEQREMFNAPEARQGVAVDENFVYVVGSQQIAKYDKKTHELIKKWIGKETGPIIHLDSGAIIDGKIYCAHSNYSGVPMTSSVEVWDAETLEHIDSHSFGINWGSCTWIDRLDGSWYAGFGHYNKLKHLTGKGSEWTVVVKFDDDWRFLESWVFPEEVYTKFGRMSNSGGSFGPDGLLYCTGHDNPELYVLKFPKQGSELELVEILPIENAGQGIAWDRSNPGFIYAMKKKEREIIVSELINK